MKRTRVERGIYRQQNGNYGIYVLANGQLRWKTVGTKLAEARGQRELMSAQAQQGELPRRCTLTFSELAETWIEGFEAQVRSGERAERTLEDYRYHLKLNLLPTLGRKKLQQIST